MQGKHFKTIIGILIVVLTALLVYYFCYYEKDKPNSQDETSQTLLEKKSYDFESCYRQDYNDMVQKYGEGNFMFYWAEAKMDKNVNDASFDESCNVLEVSTLFQVNDDTVCYQYTHPEGAYNSSNVIIDTFYGRWTGCMDINLVNINLTLKEAIRHFKNKDSHNAYGNYIVMRCPFYPPFPTSPYWIFGDEDYFLVLDEHGNIFNP